MTRLAALLASTAIPLALLAGSAAAQSHASQAEPRAATTRAAPQQLAQMKLAQVQPGQPRLRLPGEVDEDEDEDEEDEELLLEPEIEPELEPEPAPEPLPEPEPEPEIVPEPEPEPLPEPEPEIEVEPEPDVEPEAVEEAVEEALEEALEEEPVEEILEPAPEAPVDSPPIVVVPDDAPIGEPQPTEPPVVEEPAPAPEPQPEIEPVEPPEEPVAVPVPEDQAPPTAPGAPLVPAPDAVVPELAAPEPTEVDPALAPMPEEPPEDVEALLAPLVEEAAGLADVRAQRRERRIGERIVTEEPGARLIVQERERLVIVTDERERLRRVYDDIETFERDDGRWLVARRPGGVEVITVVDDAGNLLRRSRRYPDGREIVLIDNSWYWEDGIRTRERDRRDVFVDLTIVVPPPPVRELPPYYVVEFAPVVGMPRGYDPMVLDAFAAAPVAPLPRVYTLDEVRFNEALRAYMARVDLDAVTFDTGSWRLSADQVRQLAPVARAMREVLVRNPNEIFLVEGHTDAVGRAIDNLSLSDRRAESVAFVLSEVYGIPPENLVTQGYGEEFLKIDTQEAERRNRRVAIRRITPLIVQARG